MSVFTEKEIDYMNHQQLGRLATISPSGKPMVTPVGYRYNPKLDVIEIGGHNTRQTKKFQSIQKNPNVAFVIDDVLPPWKARGIQIRGTAEALPTGGKEAFGHLYEADAGLIRITPEQIITWGIEEGEQSHSNRKVERAKSS